MPMASGMVVLLNIWPINAPMPVPKTICKKPWAEAAVPATSPKGSMANAPKFGMNMLNVKNQPADKAKNNQTGSACK